MTKEEKGIVDKKVEDYFVRADDILENLRDVCFHFLSTDTKAVIQAEIAKMIQLEELNKKEGKE